MVLKPVTSFAPSGPVAVPATRVAGFVPPAPPASFPSPSPLPLPLPFVDRRAQSGGKRTRIAAVADEERPFRSFLAEQLRRLGFEVELFDSGDATLDFVRSARADLAIVNVYLRGKLGVEVTEEIRSDSSLAKTRVVLIGALFRANRFRANPTNLYGADEYIEELIPEREFRHVIRKLFPEIGGTGETAVESVEVDESRRLARLILSDIVIYNAAKVERGIRDNSFFEVLRDEIAEGRQYFESRVPSRVRQHADIFSETLQLFVQMKREELERLLES